MPKFLRPRGVGSNIATVVIVDLFGAPKTGLTNASSGLLIAVRRELSSAATAYSGGNIGTISTLGTWADPGSGKCNFKEVDATNLAGFYEIHFRDSVYDASDASRSFHGAVYCTGCAATPFEIQFDNSIAVVSQSGIAQAGGANTITLPTSASSVDDFYKNQIVKVYFGTGSGQSRRILGYVGSTRVATVARAWATNPDSTSVECVFADDSGEDIIEGSVSDAGAAAGDFDGNSGLSSSDDFYNGAVLNFTTGTLRGIARKISDFVGSSRNLQFNGATGAADAPFPTAPANGDKFEILGRIG